MDTERKSKLNISCIARAFVSVFTPAFLLLVYGPVMIYSSNTDELNYNTAQLLEYMIPAAVLVAVVGALILLLLRCLSVRVYYAAETLLLGFTIAALIQGTFLTAYLPVIDGEYIDWNAFPVQRVLSIIIWAGSFALAFAVSGMLRKKDRKIAAVMIFILAFLLVSGTVTAFTVGDSNYNKKLVCGQKGILDMSEDENLVVIMADAVDEEAFERVAAEHPEYSETFKDFTLFSDTMTAYPFTSHAIPFIMTGQWYENEMPYREYTASSFAASPILNELKAREYRLGFYAPEFPIEGIFENYYESTRFAHPLKFIELQTLLSCYRSMPHDLKQYCEVNWEGVYYNSVHADGDDFYNPENSSLLTFIESNDVVISKKKCFRFISFDGAHVPFNGKAQSDAFEDNSYESAIESAVSLIDTYLGKLRSAGVYDNTIIIVLADHGWDGNSIIGRQNPFLLIKGTGESHPFESSGVPVSHADMQSAMLRLIDGSSAEDAFDYKEGDSRERRFLFFRANDLEHLEEYFQTGKARDDSTMMPTGKTYTLETAWDGWRG